MEDNMKITKEWLQKKDACQEGIDWFCNQKEIDSIVLIKKSIKEKLHLDWANWLIVRTMKYKQYVAYAIYAAEQVIDIYEKKNPEDDRPRRAIEAAKKCLKKKTKKAAAYAYAAYAYAADAAAYAADAAAYAAAAAAAVYVDAYAADAAAYAAYAVDAKRKKLQIKILNFGLKLLGDV